MKVYTDLDCCVLAATGHLTTLIAMIIIGQHLRQHTLFGVLSAQISLLGPAYPPEMSVGRTTDAVSQVGSLLHMLTGVRAYSVDGRRHPDRAVACRRSHPFVVPSGSIMSEACLWLSKLSLRAR